MGMSNYISGEQVETSIVEIFVEKITHDKSEHTDRLCEDSHNEEGEFLEMLQNIDYKKMCNKPHQDALISHNNEGATQNRHPYFENINTQLFDIDNSQYLTELFTQEIPVDLFRLNWERDEYGKFDQFKKCEDLPKIRVYDLEPFVARLVKSVSSVGISTWSSCEGHWGEPVYIKFDGKYHRLWCQAIFNTFVKKKLNLVCNWEWCGWDERCFISSPGGDILELYLEIQAVARLIYDNRIFLRNSKKQVCSLLTDKHKSMNKKNLLNAFENYFEEFCKVN